MNTMVFSNNFFFLWLFALIILRLKISFQYQSQYYHLSQPPPKHLFRSSNLHPTSKHSDSIDNLCYHSNLWSNTGTSEIVSKAPHQYIKLIGTGSKSPSTVFTNYDLEKIVNTSDNWITTRTGISRRHILGTNESLSELAIQASHNALKNAKLDPNDLDMIILASSTPDDLFGDACQIGSKIGAEKACCFDLTAACSGFLYGLITASQFIQSGAYKNILVIGADALSKWVDWNDRNTCIIFGDGAGAVLCQGSDQEQDNGLLSWVMYSDGSKKHHLTLNSQNKTTNLNDQSNQTVHVGNYNSIHMNGKEVFLFATREVPAVINEVLAKANLTIENVDWLLLHQANQRILNSVAEKLGLPKHKILSNLDEYGNTSAASIPLCLDAAVSSGKVKKGDIIVIAGFGAGLSWGASLVRWGGVD